MEYENCPVGIRNEQEIVHTQETFKMALQRMEEKIDDLKADVTSGFSSVNNRLDKVEKRLDSLEESLPKKIDERIDLRNKTGVYNIIKWLIVTVGGSALITVISRTIS